MREKDPRGPVGFIEGGVAYAWPHRQPGKTFRSPPRPFNDVNEDPKQQEVKHGSDKSGIKEVEGH